MSDRHDSISSDGLDASTRPIVELLMLRTEHLRRRPGLCDRVMDAVEREIDAPVVAGRIGPSREWRIAALAAVVMLLLVGFIASIMVRGDRAIEAAPQSTDFVALADASPAERMLIALLDDPGLAGQRERAEIIEEMLPGCGVQLDDLDRELRRIIGDATIGAGR